MYTSYNENQTYVDQINPAITGLSVLIAALQPTYHQNGNVSSPQTWLHNSHLHCENPLINPKVSDLITELLSRMTAVVIAIVCANDFMVKQNIKPNQTQNLVCTCPDKSGI